MRSSKSSSVVLLSSSLESDATIFASERTIWRTGKQNWARPTREANGVPHAQAPEHPLRHGGPDGAGVLADPWAPLVKEPNIEQLVQRGVVFESAYCASPPCAPSRFSMMAGRLPSGIGARNIAPSQGQRIHSSTPGPYGRARAKCCETQPWKPAVGPSASRFVAKSTACTRGFDASASSCCVVR